MTNALLLAILIMLRANYIARSNEQKGQSWDWGDKVDNSPLLGGILAALVALGISALILWLPGVVWAIVQDIMTQ